MAKNLQAIKHTVPQKEIFIVYWQDAYTYNFEDTHIIITQNNACVHIRTMDSACTWLSDISGKITT